MCTKPPKNDSLDKARAACSVLVQLNGEVPFAELAREITHCLHSMFLDSDKEPSDDDIESINFLFKMSRRQLEVWAAQRSVATLPDDSLGSDGNDGALANDGADSYGDGGGEVGGEGARPKILSICPKWGEDQLFKFKKAPRRDTRAYCLLRASSFGEERALSIHKIHQQLVTFLEAPESDVSFQSTYNKLMKWANEAEFVEIDTGSKTVKITKNGRDELLRLGSVVMSYPGFEGMTKAIDEFILKDLKISGKSGGK